MRVALRSLRRTPGFALIAILTLALGIGLATAVFTVADALLLRRLPVQDQDRVVVLWEQKSIKISPIRWGSTTPASSHSAPECSSALRHSPPGGPRRYRFATRTRSRACAARSFRVSSLACSAGDPRSVEPCSRLMMCTARRR